MEHEVIIIGSNNEVGQEEKVLLGSMARFLASAAGRQQLAAFMIAPLRRNIDYAGIARKVFLVQELPPGALPTYDKDIK